MIEVQSVGDEVIDGGLRRIGQDIGGGRTFEFQRHILRLSGAGD